ncbi:hypothetical protein [Filimonas effusa]|uniref:DUF1343 domain-containing protein n=1 Tax=Filimonas effusa TaxID=2508721 RepID=A0A4Q1D9F7_9BACT|nr:hypothetical protein [Filimonas effusa]RXK86012.1 hypothetical protein ESB13_04165 [Filimonas effusa]
MKQSLSLVLFFMVLDYCCYAQDVKPEIKQYVTFVAQQNTSAKDYILNLFKKYDIVILCERQHTETTQYNLIYDVINTEYFQKNVGAIFTEVGSYSNRQNTFNFTKTRFANDSIKQLEQAVIYRNGFFPPLWNNTNFYDFTGRINTLNASLKENRQINLLTCGTKNPSAEEQATPEAMKKYVKDNFKARDSLMASYIIHDFDSMQLVSKRKKALVIMNYRHAFSKNLFAGDANVGTFIFGKYPGKVANVFINHLALTNEVDQRDKDKPKMFQGMQMTPVQDGKWDAAFKAANKENLGFDFKNSPFGNDNFDLWPAETEYTYQDIFTGFIYYLPLEKQENAAGVKNFLNGANFEEIVRGWNLFNKAAGKNEERKYTPEFEKAMIQETSTFRVWKYQDLKKYRQIIDQWLNK